MLIYIKFQEVEDEDGVGVGLREEEEAFKNPEEHLKEILHQDKKDQINDMDLADVLAAVLNVVVVGKKNK